MLVNRKRLTRTELTAEVERLSSAVKTLSEQLNDLNALANDFKDFRWRIRARVEDLEGVGKTQRPFVPLANTAVATEPQAE